MFAASGTYRAYRAYHALFCGTQKRLSALSALSAHVFPNWPIRAYLLLLCLALFVPSLQAQSGTYASSAEYQGMLEELHTPAPSPIYLATGQRPLPDQSLKVKQHDTRATLTLKTQSTANHHRPPGRHPNPAQPANPRLLGVLAPGSNRSPSPTSPANKTTGPSLSVTPPSPCNS